jgi:cAMP-dependent protein kinase regulator
MRAVTLAERRGTVMASVSPTHSPPPDVPESEARDRSVDQALMLLLADEANAALRWAAAIVGRDSARPSALVVASRLLEQMGRRGAAIAGLELALREAVGAADVPLALAAIDGLRAFGQDVGPRLDGLAVTFCRGSRPPEVALPLFGALEAAVLRDLFAAFEVVTLGAGHRALEQGTRGDAVYLVAHGTLEVSRRSTPDASPIVLARLGSGALFGEMALLSHLPVPASVVATRPSILLVASVDRLNAVAARHPEIVPELAAHCRRHVVENLGLSAPALAHVPPQERALLVERLESRSYESGEKLSTYEEEASGLHLVATGEVAMVAHEGAERVVLATLGAGDTLGEVELVLCRRADADAIAVRPTATLFLPREHFNALAADHPAILHAFYMAALQRSAEARLAMIAPAVVVAADVFDDAPPATVAPRTAPHPPPLPPPVTPPPPPVPPPLPQPVPAPLPQPAPPLPPASLSPMTASVASAKPSTRAASGATHVSRVIVIGAIAASVLAAMISVPRRWYQPAPAAAGTSVAQAIPTVDEATAADVAPPAELAAAALISRPATATASATSAVVAAPRSTSVTALPRARVSTPVASVPPRGTRTAATPAPQAPVAPAPESRASMQPQSVPDDADRFGGRD